MRLHVLLAAALLALWVGGARALFFHVNEGQQRCFIEEVPAETLVVGTYKSPDSTAAEGSANVIQIVVKDPSGVQLMAKNADTSGKFAYTSQVGGEYQICIVSKASRWTGSGKKFRFDLRLDIGEMGIDYSEVAKKEHLSELEVEVRRLNDKVKDIMREQSYQREREVSFRNTSESTNARVQWWSLFQVAVMLVAGLWQISHLKTFFARKKNA